jgi:hypothetical protein
VRGVRLGKNIPAWRIPWPNLTGAPPLAAGGRGCARGCSLRTDANTISR